MVLYDLSGKVRDEILCVRCSLGRFIPAVEVSYMLSYVLVVLCLAVECRLELLMIMRYSTNVLLETPK